MAQINPELIPYVESSDFPHQYIPKIAALGISGMDVPKSMGGGGMSTIDACSIMYELARKDASIATFWLLHHSLGLYTV